MSQSYNGWANYETWNVALWLQNDEFLYAIMQSCKGSRDPYKELIETLELSNIVTTGDGVEFTDDRVDQIEIIEMMTEN